MLAQAVLVLSLCLAALAVTSPTKTTPLKRDSSQFITTQGNQFVLDGKPFNFIGTNAYWLTSFNDTENVRTTLQTIKSTNATVVRLWAFNDVAEEPTDNSTFFQIFKNGVATVNTGPNGLQRLDAVISIAEELGLKVFLTTTNNWNPTANATATSSPAKRAAPSPFPRGFLSNDYGGMDFYVQQLIGKEGTHDDFFTNDSVKNVYKSYLNSLVTRYKDSTTLFAWEISNDARCNSTFAASPDCQTTTVTSWVSEIAQHISSLDPNHLISSGTQGFQCMQELAPCPKLFATPSPTPSPAVEKRQYRRGPPLNKKALLDIRNNVAKRRASLEPRDTTGGVAIRGRWVSTAAKRQQSSASGGAFDGSFGVDSEDISAIPQVGFSSFQLFPDQNTYFPSNPNLNNSENTRDTGLQWIQSQAMSGQSSGKPTLLTSFGAVTQNNSGSFVPFNDSEVPPTLSGLLRRQSLAAFGITDEEQISIYSDWVNQAITSGVNGILQYQWGQDNLVPLGGGGVVTTSQNNQGTTAPNGDAIGVSPNDGYSVQQGTPQGNALNQIIAAGAARQAVLNAADALL